MPCVPDEAAINAYCVHNMCSHTFVAYYEVDRGPCIDTALGHNITLLAFTQCSLAIRKVISEMCILSALDRKMRETSRTSQCVSVHIQ